MIAIKDRSGIRVGAKCESASQMFDLLLEGERHWDPTISSIFLRSRQLAANAVSENSETTMIVASLLLFPCQILASGSLAAGLWTSESLLKTGTFDWLEENFGEEVAEIIRLQPVAKRFLSTVIPKYFNRLDSESQRSIFSNGGFMSACERMTFSQNRLHFNAMRIARWLDGGLHRSLEVPEMDFFRPFIERALIA